MFLTEQISHSSLRPSEREVSTAGITNRARGNHRFASTPLFSTSHGGRPACSEPAGQGGKDACGPSSSFWQARGLEKQSRVNFAFAVSKIKTLWCFRAAQYLGTHVSPLPVWLRDFPKHEGPAAATPGGGWPLAGGPSHTATSSLHYFFPPPGSHSCLPGSLCSFPMLHLLHPHLHVSQDLQPPQTKGGVRGGSAPLPF